MVEPWEHLLPPPSSDNEARFHRVAWAMAGTLLAAGPDALQVARVARKSGVSRAWIYKYLGADPDARLAFAVRLYGLAFAAPDTEAPPADGPAWLAAVDAGTRKGLHDVLDAPWCVLVYVRYRHAQNVVGAHVRAVEREALTDLVARMPPVMRRDRARAERFAWGLHAARMGVYHQWLDPVFRDTVGEDGALAPVLALARGFASG